MPDHYFIIEHPTRGVLRDLEETDSGRIGRFSVTLLRSEAMHFYRLADARKARARITGPASAGCQIRSSDYDPDQYLNAWPVVG